MTAVVTLCAAIVPCSPAGTTTTTAASTSCPIATPERGWRQLSGDIILLCLHALTRFRNGPPPCGSAPAKGSFLYSFEFIFFLFWLKFSSRLFRKLMRVSERNRTEPDRFLQRVRSGFWASGNSCDRATWRPFNPFYSADAQKPMELQLSARYLVPRRPKIR